MKTIAFKWNTKMLGDHAVLFSLPEQINHETSREVQNLCSFIKSKNDPFVKDIIPSYHTIVIVYDILYSSASPIVFCDQVLAAYNNNQVTFENLSKSKNLIIPVCYDLEFGIDLENIAISKNISIEEIISIHSNTIYDVYAIGFLPGFTYMGKVDPSIQMPRHPKPRTKIEAGSVGIAGMQTGVYPTASPGGWQIIGRTPIKMFDRTKLSFCIVGDTVQFKSIDMDMFNQLNEW